MTRKSSGYKRKNSVSDRTEPQSSTSQDEEPDLEDSDSDNDDLLNSIDDETGDSTDSDGEIEDSEEETQVGAESEDNEDADDESNPDDDDIEDDSDDNEEEATGEDEDETGEEEGTEESEEEEDSSDDQESSTDEVELNGNNKTDDEKIKKDSTSKPQKSTPKTKKPTKTPIETITKIGATNSKPTSEVDEYEYDTSDEEDIRNTVGNIPKNWYNEYSHLGYDWDGQKILKPETGDQLDAFLKKLEDPDFWKTVKDPQTGQDVVLGDDDIQLIRRIQAQRIPDASFEEYAPWIEWFTSEVMKTPLRKFPEHKRSFLPSRNESKKVSKLVHALKMGWIKTREEAAKLRAKKEPQFYMLWQTDDTAEEMRRIHKHIAAPKRHLPGHAESYNPPPEYLFDTKELKEWNKLKNSPWKRKLHFIPQKYSSLRTVPSYSRFIKERFLRCLDLYLCPRAIKMRLNIEPESLVPQLPSPRDLQPFPTVLSMEFEGHTDMIRSMSCDTKGQYLITGSDDQTIKIWEINTGRCLRTVELGEVVHKVAWCPNAALSLVAVAAGQTVYLINPMVGDHLVVSKTDTILQEAPLQDVIVADRIRNTIKWEQADGDDWDKKGIRVKLDHFKTVTQVTWHGRGDYFATVMPDGQNRSVLINQLSRRRSQLPFTKSKGLVQCVLFHPVRPYLFVATQRNVRIYDLVKQELVKKLLSNSRWISSMAIHPGGDNLLVGTYDRKMLWFDLDLSTKPYQTLRLHGTAIRGVAYHKRYPLFASGSDDRSLIVSHGMVYNDLLQNPLIVPLKRLQNHKQFNDFGIFDVMFHPSQPWVFSAGADATVKLYS